LSFFQGLGIGSVTNSTLSLLQRTATSDEMGRASSAHQFLRSFGGTLGIALAGTVLLAVVQRRIGSVKPVQALLSRKEVAISRPAQQAIVAGFRASALVAVVLTTMGLAISILVHRRLHRSPVDS
jgi:hypothetical protein